MSGNDLVVLAFLSLFVVGCLCSVPFFLPSTSSFSAWVSSLELAAASDDGFLLTAILGFFLSCSSFNFSPRAALGFWTSSSFPYAYILARGCVDFRAATNAGSSGLTMAG